MAFKIYTKTGDRGETSLWGGARVAKHHLRIESYGTIDELNSFVGWVRDGTPDEELRRQLHEIQNRLFVLGSILASDPSKSMPAPDLNEADVQVLEHSIDAMEAELPPLKNFILPGGHTAVSACHVARCVCRRAERLVVALSEQEPVEGLVLPYLNRLSDYLFVLARYLGKLYQAPEVLWQPRRP